MAGPAYALSLKQPWAALVLLGLKTVEVRSWPARRRGPLLIHAARIPDPRPGVWDQVPLTARATTQLAGGIIGAVELVDCLLYATAESFAADRARHLNDPSWFKPPGLYGFVLENARPLPFRRFAGQVRFFVVPPG